MEKGKKGEEEDVGMSRWRIKSCRKRWDGEGGRS
jgi:hypothetical protein